MTTLPELMGIRHNWCSPDRPDREAILYQWAFNAGARAYREFKRGTPGYCYLPTETEAWRAGWKAEAEKDGQP